MRNKFYVAAFFVGLIGVGTGVAFALGNGGQPVSSAAFISKCCLERDCCPDGECCPDGPCCDEASGCCPDGNCCPDWNCCQAADASSLNCCPSGDSCPNGACCSSATVVTASDKNVKQSAGGFVCPANGETLPCEKCCPLNKSE